MLKKLFTPVKDTKPNYRNRKRMLFVFSIVVLLFAALTLRVGWHMIIKGDEYAQKAQKQQTIDSVVTAVRGDILDSSGGHMAISATTHTIWVRPSSVKNNGKTQDEIDMNARLEAKALADILELDEESVLATITSDKTIVRVAKFVDADKTEAVRAAKLTADAENKNSEMEVASGNMKATMLNEVTKIGNEVAKLKKLFDDFGASAGKMAEDAQTLIDDTKTELKAGGVPVFSQPKSVEAKLPDAPVYEEVDNTYATGMSDEEKKKNEDLDKLKAMAAAINNTKIEPEKKEEPETSEPAKPAGSSALDEILKKAKSIK